MDRLALQEAADVRDDGAAHLAQVPLDQQRISSDFAGGPDCAAAARKAGRWEAGGAASRGSGRRDGVRGGGGGGGIVRADAARAGGQGGQARREQDDEVVEEVVEPDRVEVAHLSYEWEYDVGTGM